MKLNMDCIRSILLCVENNTGLRKYCFFVDTDLNEAMSHTGDVEVPRDYQSELLKTFNNNELIYHVHYCIKAELICETDSSNPYIIMIADLTPKGHELVNNIRNTSNWEKTKETGSQIGAFGLNMVVKIAEGVATAGLNKFLGLS